jgi:type III secretion protein Q
MSDKLASHAPLKLPVLSASVAQARAAVARRGVALPLQSWQLPGPVPTLSLSLAGEPSGVDGQHLLGHEPLTRLDFEWAGAHFHVDFTTAAIDHWAQISLGGSTLQTLDPPWKSAAISAAVRWLTDTFTQLGRGQARCIGQSEAGAQRPAGRLHSIWWSLYAPDGSSAFHGLMHMDNLGLILLASLLPEHELQATQRPLDNLEHLQVPLRLSVGSTSLQPTQLQGLKRGDVVFLTQRTSHGEQHLLLQSDAHWGECWQVGAQLNHLQLILLETPRLMSDNPESPDTSGDSEPISLDSLPIRVTFDVGDKVLTLAQLKTLSSGDTLNLDRPPQEYVTIRAQGAVIGRGHLVEIDNRLGVAIDLLRAPEAATPPSAPVDTE